MSKGNAPRPATPLKPTWGTAKDHDAADGAALTYYGNERGAVRRKGRRVTVSRPAGRLVLRDAKTGDLVLNGGNASRFWARTTPAGRAAAGRKADTPAVTPQAVSEAIEGSTDHPGRAWLRLMQGAELSQTETARRMGVAPVTLNRLVRGRSIPTARMAVAFAKAVGANPRVVWGQVCEYELTLALRERQRDRVRGDRGHARKRG